MFIRPSESTSADETEVSLDRNGLFVFLVLNPTLRRTGVDENERIEQICGRSI